jgi:hypothetical protein
VAKKTKPVSTFQSYNPYEARYPGLRVVSRENLHLIKILRLNGFKVSVQPENGTKLCYLAQKGVREFLSDPIVALTITTYLSILTSILSSWIYDKLKRQPQEDETNIVLEVDEDGRRVRYNQSGKPISNERFQSIIDLMKHRAEQYGDSLKIEPPDLSRPYPIYLEHSSQIIGWAGKLHKEEDGFKLHGVRITDEQARLRIQFDDLTGFSIGGIIQKSTCSVCKQDYVECNHITGNYYDEKECTVRIDKILIADFSIVQNPVQPLARLEKHRKYYGSE